MFDSDPIASIIDEMQTIIVRSGGEIDKYSFTNTSNKASVTGLIKSTLIELDNIKKAPRPIVYAKGCLFSTLRILNKLYALFKGCTQIVSI